MQDTNNKSFPRFLDSCKKQQLEELKAAEKDSTEKKSNPKDVDLRAILNDAFTRYERKFMMTKLVDDKNSKEKKTVTTKLPVGFKAFFQSDLCLQLTQSIYDYINYLLKIEKKKKELASDATARGIPVPQVLKSE